MNRTRTLTAGLIAAASALAVTGLAPATAHATFAGNETGAIAFTTVAGTRSQIAVANPDGSAFHLVSPQGQGMALAPQLIQPVFSPDGSRIAFAETGGSNAIWTANADGSHPIRLTNPHNLTDGSASSSDVDPAWSPDGKLVYFTRQYPGNASTEIHHAFADGSGEAALITVPTGISVSTPDVAPNGDVAYHMIGGGAPAGVYIWDHATKNSRLFATDGANPSYSPDGGQIAFDAPAIFVGRAVYTQPATGSGTAILVQGTGFGADPAWSPDGTRITYTDHLTSGAARIKIITLAGGAITGVDTGATPGVTDSSSSWQSIRHATIDRVGGADRVDTAVATSRLAFNDTGTGGRQATAAVLSRQDTFADALAGSALAARSNGPLLLTATGGLDPRTAAELRRSLAKGSTVFLLGGPDVMSPAVAAQVAALGFLPRRLAGPDRYATAVAIADAVTPNPTRVIVATGNNFPDALAAGAAAGATPNTVVLLSSDKVLPQVTRDYLAAHVGTTTELYGVGDQGAAALRTAFPADRVHDVAGPDRYATASAVATTFFAGPGAPHTIGVATGTNWPDALAGGALLGIHQGPLLLANGSTVPSVEAAYAASQAAAVDEVLVFGDSGVVPDKAALAAGDLVALPGKRDSFQNRQAPALP